MDWSSFWTGFLAGIVSTGGTILCLCFWWARPYMTAARDRSQEAMAVKTPAGWTGGGWNVEQTQKETQE